MYPKML